MAGMVPRRLKLVILLALLLLPVIGGGLLLGLLRSPAVREWAVERLTAGGHLRVSGLSLVWPLSLKADRLDLLDRQGVWLSAVDLSVDAALDGLWHRQLRIRRLSAAGLRVLRRPRSGGDGAAAVVPRIPVAIAVEQLSLPVVEVGPSLLGWPFRAGLTAMTVVDPAAGRVDIGRFDLAVEGGVRLRGSGRLDGSRLAFCFSAGLSDPGALWSGLGGPAMASGVIGGTLENPRLSAALRVPVIDPRLAAQVGLRPRLSLALAFAQASGSALLRLRLAGLAAGGRIGRRILVGATAPIAGAETVSGGHYRGRVALAALLVGRTDHPFLGLRAAATGRWDDRPLSAVLQAAADRLPLRPQGEAVLAVTAFGRDLRARADLAWGPVVRLDGLSLWSGGSGLEGALRWAPATGRFDGHLSLRVPDLAEWRTVAGVDLAGRLAAELSLRSTGGQSAQLTLNGEDLSLSARARLRPGVYVLSALQLDWREASLRLLAPAALSVRPGGWRLDRLALALNGGRLSLAGGLTDGVIDGALAVTALPLAPLAVILPAWQPSGTVSGRVTAGGPLARPGLVARLSAANLDVGHHRAGIDATLDLDWDGRRLAGHAAARGLNGARFTAQGSLPMEMVEHRPQIVEGRLAGRLDGHGDLGRIAELLPLGDQAVGGRLAVALDLGGTVGMPAFAGRLAVSDGSYRNFDSGTSLEGIALAAAIADSHRVTFSGGGRDSGKGTFTLSGRGDPLEGTANLQARLNRLAVARLDLFRGDATGDLTFDRDPLGAALAGQLTVSGGDVDIGQLMPAAIVPLKVIEVNLRHPGSRRSAAASPPPPALPVTLALDLALPDLQLRGKGLDSRWTGRLHLAGQPDRPLVTGQMTVVRGTYTLLGRPLRLSSGRLAFDGEQPPDPRVDATAGGQTAGVTVEVRLTGTMSSPDFTFTSDPPLPRDEVLAHLLFGNSAGQLSVMQQISLAHAAANELAGGSGLFDPLDKLRRFLGLDMLQAGGDLSSPLAAPGLPDPAAAAVSATQAGTPPPGAAVTRSSGASLTLGKYLTPKTYLTVDQGTGGGRVTVEEDVGHGFALDTRLGEGSGGAVGFSWKHDY